jgi:hypothetical protein
MSKWANAIETFRFKVARFTQDDVIYETQELRRLLEAAKQYFIGGSDVPVWLEARGNCETNTRYAVVCNHSTGSDTNPYQLPFDMDHPVMTPWTLVVERQHWRDKAPGLSTCVELSATQDYYDASDANFVPTESGDDCYIDNAGAGSIWLNSVFNAIGAGAAGSTFGTGLRFRRVAIPQGAIILYAYVEVESDANLALDDVNVNIAADDVDNSAIFSTYANYIGRVRTGAIVAWNAVAHWVAGTHYQTPAITAVVQEIISRPGWVSGNDLSILIDNNASTAGSGRNMVSWDHAAIRYEPHLYVGWLDSTTRTFGRTATCLNEVYVANKHNLAQLTHAFHYDISAGIYSTNLIGAGFPFAFLPAIPAANDAVYFGITDAHPTMYGPFNSVVFDIGTAQTQITGITWEYYDGVGAAWAVIPNFRDNTNANGAETAVAFDTTGVNSFHFEPVDAVGTRWGVTAINGVSAYWVRARVTAVGGAPTPPTQQNRDFYSVVTPYIDTLAAQIPGDIPALAELIAEGQSGDVGDIAGQTILYAGLRSYVRGADFSAFINLSDVQSGLTIPITVNGATAVFANDREAATGRYVNVAFGAPAAEGWQCYATIPTALVDDYAGIFRCFLRVKATWGSAYDLKFRLKICNGLYTNTIFQTNQCSSLGGGGTVIETLDFGKITIPPTMNDIGETYKNIILRIDCQALVASAARLFDIVLLPIDECFLDTRAISPPDSLVLGTINAQSKLNYDNGEWKRLDMDSTIPRRLIKTDVQLTTGVKVATWSAKISSPLIWQPNVRQRWWFLQSDLNPGYQSLMHDGLSLQGWEVSRYLSMRGKR